MKRNVRSIEVRSADDKLLFSLRVYDEEPRDASGHTGREDGKGRSGNGNGAKDSGAMSEAQKRYLFRILAERGLEGDEAHHHLKERFGTESLDDVSKREASTMIEQLLEEAEAK